MSRLELRQTAITEAKAYLNERSLILTQEHMQIENRYDTMPAWGWQRIDEITREINRIGRIMEGL